MTNRQKEEFAKLLMDIGKLTLGSLVFGVFQFTSNPLAVFIVALLGLTLSFGFFTMGLYLFKEIK